MISVCVKNRDESKASKNFTFENLECGDSSEILPKKKWSISVEWMEPHLELIRMEFAFLSLYEVQNSQ